MIRLADKNKCTGCCACLNSCPFGALQMTTDRYGFFRPHIDEKKCTACGQCEKACPILYTPVIGREKPGCYAAWAPDEIRQVSSSGGIFSILAKWIFQQGGIVYGVGEHGAGKFDFPFVRMKTEADLQAARGSKYVQAYAGLVYQQVRNDLKDGKKVLFTGTPCQAAALRKIIGEDASNLYIVDVVCHGVPSQKMFRECLATHISLEKTEHCYFRDKSLGWQATNLLITGQNGTINYIPYEKSYYEKAFHQYIDLQDSCYDCPFCGLKRQGDLTIGDFWGVDAYKKDWNDGKGTSLILANTDKGDFLLKSILPLLTRLESVPLAYAIGNRLHEISPVPRERFRFLDAWEKKSVYEAIKEAVDNHFDIGLVGDWGVENYGANITYYALYAFLHEQMGYDVLLIERPANAVWKPKNPPTLFQKVPYPEYAMARYAQDKGKLFAFNEKCDAFIVGSDQIWNNDLYHAFGEWADLNWVDNSHRKIAYATSFGRDEVLESNRDRVVRKHFFERFDAISVREDTAVPLMKKQYGVESTQVLDPVFLCEKEKYNELTKDSCPLLLSEPAFIFSYTLDMNEEKRELLHQAAQLSGNEVIIAGDAAKSSSDEGAEVGNWKANLSLEEWLAHIQTCQFMITDSFHGMCFAIINHKPFIAIVNQHRGATRFYSLLKQLGLEDRAFNSIHEAGKNLRKLFFEPIDWENVDEKLAEARKHSLEWLKHALHAPRTKSEQLSDYDILAPNAARHDEHIHYIDNYSYIDVLPSQAASGKRTRLALGDQFCELQIFDEDNRLISCRRLIYQDDLQQAQQSVANLQQWQQNAAAKLQQLQENTADMQALRKNISDLQLAVQQSWEREQALLNSRSFRLGRMLTWGPRKVRNLLRAFTKK